MRTAVLVGSIVLVLFGVWLWLNIEPAPSRREGTHEANGAANPPGLVSPDPGAPTAQGTEEPRAPAREQVLHVQGVVVRTDDTPAPGADVTLLVGLSADPLARTKTDEDGAFRIEVRRDVADPTEAGMYFLVQAAAGAERAWPVLFDPEEPQRLRLTLKPAAQLQVLVEDPAGKPVAGAQIHCFRTGPTGGERGGTVGGIQPSSTWLVTNAEGLAPAHVLPGRYWIRARRKRTAAFGAPLRLALQPGANDEVVLAAPDGERRASIRVQETNGRPVPGAWVSLSQAEQSLRHAVATGGAPANRLGRDLGSARRAPQFLYTDEDGVLALAHEDPIEVAVGSPIHEIQVVTISPQETASPPQVVRLARRAMGHVRLSAGDGTLPPPTWHVSQQGIPATCPYPDATGGDYLWCAIGDPIVEPTSALEARVHFPAPGTYKVSVQLAGTTAASAALEVPADGTQPEDVTLRVAGWVGYELVLQPAPETNAGLHDVRRTLIVWEGRGDAGPSGPIEWRRVTAWYAAQHAGGLRVVVPEDATHLLVAGQSPLDDLPGLPVVVDLPTAAGFTVEVPLLADGWGLLSVHVPEGADDKEVSIRRMQDDPIHDPRVPRRRRTGWWLPLTEGRLRLRLLPGRYELARRGGRAVDVVVSRGQDVGLALR